MMISFQNPGIIDPRCITTIGVSVKEGDNPIGFFGTGLKYAISIILRKGGAVSIWRGMEEYRFDTAAATIRGADFAIVRMNGAELGFTTDLGKCWECWQAFREVWCNTKDEAGRAERGRIEPAEGRTTLHIDLLEFDECFYDRQKYLLETAPICDGPIVSFHPGPSAGVFYRSILVGAIDSKPFLYTPNIAAKTALTEDRTIKDRWSVMGTLARAVLQNDDTAFIERVITAPKEYYESEMDLDWPSFEPSLAFLDAVRRVAKDTSRNLNKTAHKVYLRHQPREPLVTADLLPNEAKALQDAIGFCRALRFAVDEFPVLVVESLGEGILAIAEPSLRRIVLARAAIQMGDLMLASTLIEEWAHIKHGFEDCARPMQNWLFQQVVNLGQAYLYERDRVTT